METATETERKYDVPETFELPDLAGVGAVTAVDGAETHDLDATYFDTEDLRLMRNRRTLRRRSGGNDAGWHLKTPGDGDGRTEHRLPASDSDEVPDELTGLVRAIVRRRPLGPVARLRTHRVETPLRDADGRTLALVAQDRVLAESAGAESVWQEVEVELVDGGPELLDEVERRLFAAGARPARGPSKVARALAGRLAAASGSGKTKTKTKVNPVLRYAREQRDAIVGHDPAARRGEPRAVHRMRVATRRLRSTLKTYKRSFPESDLRDELRWLAGVLGAVRDPQVLEDALLAQVAQAGPEFAPAARRVRAHLEHRVERGRAELAEALDSDRYLTLLDRIDELADTPELTVPDPVTRARKVLAKADRKLDEALESRVEEEIHDSRKGFKQARYAVELVAPDLGKPAKRLIKRLTELQDGLGEYQDSNIARGVLRELGSDSFHLGVLYGRQEQVGEEALARVPALVRAARRRRVRRVF
ncbi:CYTH and CHAD domain-containing protein [Actinoplanes sp. NEAU-A12]|uniref:CYTH and CHAD domain-containing protein n=1 Tax=Actinoplanes sandaracinus TaxID=3045177 RepID=A0ABT6WF76_9ACTN|nr:CYTH and CHAD domain-containing protein [Actinoplanes sandaracinus]MDI6098376.1 CYTH and CHAD domain-containing protein [Actinoplanes sandaracinus]